MLTSTVKGAPQNRDPTIGAVCGKNLCASESDSQAWQDQAPTEQAPISLSQPDPNSKAISQTLSMAGTKKREGFGRGAWIPRKPAKVTPVWVATCPRNWTTNEPCNGRSTTCRKGCTLHNEDSPPLTLTHPSTMKMMTTTGEDPGLPQARLSPTRRSVTKSASAKALEGHCPKATCGNDQYYPSRAW